MAGCCGEEAQGKLELFEKIIEMKEEGGKEEKRKRRSNHAEEFCEGWLGGVVACTSSSTPCEEAAHTRDQIFCLIFRNLNLIKRGL